jgi:hypothetical protein
LTAIFAIAVRTGWSRAEIAALPQGELMHYMTLIAKPDNV